MENLRRSIDVTNSALRGTKRVDLFEPARTDPNVSIEDTVRSVAQLVKEGKFDHIGLSEVSAETVRRAQKVITISDHQDEYECCWKTGYTPSLWLRSKLARGPTTQKLETVRQ